MKQLGLLLLVSLLTNCSQVSNDLDLNLIFGEVGGLTTNSTITLNGYEVGEIKSIEVGRSYEIIVSISVNKPVPIPDDSEFVLTSETLGGASIEIVPGKSSRKLNSGQQITGRYENQSKVEGGLISFIEKVLGNPTKQDSILIEIRRLNENIERLIDKK